MEHDSSLRFDGEPRIDTLLACSACSGLTSHRRQVDRASSTATAHPSTAAVTAALLVTVDPRSSNPSRSRLGAHLPPPQLLDDVAQPQPQHSDGHGSSLPGHLVVDGDLDLVGLVDVDLKVLVPPVGARRVSASAGRVLDLDVDDRF